ncbi:MAG: antirestriction protein ArdA [Hyphomicrobiales bacterium]|nr:MAG: antirestriction protein ArdA [Hyphomicrobiales bacterium]
MTIFYAQPYDISATGFYFEDSEVYKAKIESIVNDYGDEVEEFEIQFIDGSSLDCELVKAIGVHQGSVLDIMEALDDWDDNQKLNVIIAVGECGYDFDFKTNNPDDFEVDIYHDMDMKDMAQSFVDDGLFGDIPASIINYLDMDAIARDLSCDYSETTIAGERYVYRCA